MTLKKIHVDNVDRNIGSISEDPSNPIYSYNPGCTDREACNYDESVTVDNGTCTYVHESCVELEEEQYGGYGSTHYPCEMVPLEVCRGCFSDLNGLPQHTNSDGGQGNEWCEFCNDPNAINYQASLENNVSYKGKVSMCIYKVCKNPELESQGYTVCNKYTDYLGLSEDLADNYEHDESKCVYAFQGCNCSEESAVVDFANGYCGDCMENQPSPNPEVYLQEGFVEGYCGCDNTFLGDNCNCSGESLSINCDCNSTTPIDINYCDCDKLQPKSFICGCNGSVTGTEIPGRPTPIGLEIDGINSDAGIFKNTDAEDNLLYCNCEGAKAVKYYKDINGDGTGYPDKNTIQVCVNELESANFNPTEGISTLADPVINGWTTVVSSCPDNFKDCNGVCPQDYEEVYSSSQGSVLNECSQCVHQNNVDEDCCSGVIASICKICKDDFDNNVVGALRYDRYNSYSTSNDKRVVSYKKTTNEEDTFTTCNCSNLDGLNYFSDNLDSRGIYKTDDCGKCAQEGFKNYAETITSTEILNKIGAVTAFKKNQLQLGIDETTGSRTLQSLGPELYYCTCEDVTDDTPLQEGECCFGKTKACDGNCYHVNDSSRPKTDCNGACGGNAVKDECGVCNGSGILEGFCDCEGNVNKGCGCNNIEPDQCGNCGGNNSTCVGCTDSEASNYDSLALLSCENCCEYLEQSTVTEDVLKNTQADATGQLVNNLNYLSPFTVSIEEYKKIYINKTVDSSVVKTLEDAFNANNFNYIFSTAPVDAQNKLLGLKIKGYDRQATNFNFGVTANPKVQLITRSNKVLVCERPQDNALVTYEYTDGDNTSVFTYYGVGENLKTFYNNVTSPGENLRVVNATYYFALSADLDLFSYNIEEIFAYAPQTGYTVKDSNANSYYPEFNFNGIGNLIPGQDTSLQATTSEIPNSQIWPLYNIYSVVMPDPSVEFTINFGEIGLMPPAKVLGCTDSNACNYNKDANESNNSCIYAEEGYTCNGSEISVYGCMDTSASNYDPNANTNDLDNPCIYSGCTDPEASNYDILATIDDGSCIMPIPCDGLPRTNICCALGYTNTSVDITAEYDDNSSSGITIKAINECEVCDDSVCYSEQEPTIVYVCCDDLAKNHFAGEFVENVTICSGAVCEYENIDNPTNPVDPSTANVTVHVHEASNFSVEQIESIKWVIYNRNNNVVAKSNSLKSLTNRSVKSSDLFFTDNINNFDGCGWFIPIGYKENNIWDNVEIEIKYRNVLVHALYGKNVTPTTNEGKELVNLNRKENENYSTGNTLGASIIKTIDGECSIGCDKNLPVLRIPEVCFASVKKDVVEFTELFLVIETSQKNVDFSKGYIKIYNLETGETLTELDQMENKSSYNLRFVILKDTPIGIEAHNEGGGSLSYKLISEYGKVITTKTIK